MLSFVRSSRAGLYVLSFALYLAASVFLRIVLWIVFGAESSVGFDQLLGQLLVGLVNDTVVFAYLSLCLTIFFLVFSAAAFRRRWCQYLAGILTFAALFGGLYLLPVEFFFFEEFDCRFNLVAVDYFAYPTEVLGNLWESYPIVWFILGSIIITTGIYKWTWPKVKASFKDEVALGSRLGAFACHALVVALLGTYISTDTFFVSSNRAANEIGANGISSFFRAVRSQDIDYQAFYRVLPRERAFSLMRAYLADKGGQLSSNPYSLERTFPARPEGLGKLNVVILGQESLGAQYIGAYGDSRGLSPVIDRMAPESLMFRNAYATGTRTVRGLEAMTTSFPPIPSESIVKRPGNENFANLGEVLKEHGYDVSFLYGGYGLFDNMNYFFGHNGWALSDRMDIQRVTFSNIWGVCDEDLFRHSIEYFDTVSAKGKPFASLIMSTSNHKPFSFPEGIPGIPAQKGGREAGVKYADYAIGKFFELAKTRPWFDNTLFIIIADHDSRTYGRAEIPVKNYQIPVLFYAPKHLKPGVVTKTFSQIDLSPTLMGLLGLPYTAPFYGVDVLDPKTPDVRPVLLSHNHNVAIYQGEELTVLGLQRDDQSFSYVDGRTRRRELNVEMADLAAAHLQTAYEMYQDKSYTLPSSALAMK